jgi:hypothetical protein
MIGDGRRYSSSFVSRAETERSGDKFESTELGGCQVVNLGNFIRAAL